MQLLTEFWDELIARGKRGSRKVLKRKGEITGILR